MKKFAIKAISFLVFFLFFFILLNGIYLLLIIKTDYDVIKRLESLRFNNPDFDLLVLGASTSLDGIDTKLLTESGIKSYNMAIGGSSVKTNVIQLNEYLSKCLKSPEIIIIGLNSQLVKTFDDEIINPIVEVTMPDHIYTFSDMPLLKFRWLGLEFLKMIINKDIRNAKLSYGQLKIKKTKPDHTQYKEYNLNLRKFETSSWIGELVKQCNDNNIRLLILEMPGFKKGQNQSGKGPFELSFPNGEFAYLYNFNSIDFCQIFDSNGDWLGDSHLNEFGAIKFTKKLIPYLKK